MSDCKHPTVIDGVKCLQCEIERLKEEIKQLKERLAIKDDVICASKLVIEAYEREVKSE